MKELAWYIEFQLQSDARRLEIIDEAANKLEQNYTDLVKFNTQNKLLSLQRGKDEDDIKMTRQLYGIR